MSVKDVRSKKSVSRGIIQAEGSFANVKEDMNFRKFKI